MNLVTLQQEKSIILYDADSLCDALGSHQIQSALFTPDYWRERALIKGEAPGRGSSLFLQPIPGASTQWVLRPYRRGGLIAKLSESRYIWTGRENTRAFREMRLTAALFAQGLPVPRPTAACVTRHGLTYEAALITQRIPGARALADWLSDERISGKTLNTALENVGRMIRRFHDHGLDHVDLNARNILLEPQGTPWLIDLDRCRLRSPGKWQSMNLKRLERSIHKLNPTMSIISILQGYRTRR
ncbi:3-deoxy-D-manno-octulosonic acid kinase [Halomonas vilamensis]|uniref:3-deoxy-D-manno-octulosonic acid kinase n=1 Tax=Vreelandella vilamensis TaxID=531309 RepID=A0ABU1H501_9GAMM|nr:3-deoxy-D-manno-octulosonic acid kinase [Halomonas vilamensis]MDR5898926.1 3-deoxy-D-manno-octulosonic acid kinase [Halomonas vilamensis]